MRFRDRDAPITREGLIFRTYGYDHPVGACFCDLEYAPETVYATENPRALRDGGSVRYYKFYFDGGLNFAKERYPQYQLQHGPLHRVLVGVESRQIARIVRPESRLEELSRADKDPLTDAMEEMLSLVTDASALRPRDFGVFGSLAHGFHNPKYSDIDLIIYGAKQLKELRATLTELYGDGNLRNEFDGWTPEMPPIHWRFDRYPKKLYGWYQKRKLIYASYKSRALGRSVKVEFEPVRRWSEIRNEYGATRRIDERGRVEAVVEVLSDEEAGFMPSIYPVELKEMNRGIDGDLRRVVSYMEEFRLQVEAGEDALVRGNLELVESSNERFYQIALSYGSGYFDQVLLRRQDARR